MTSVDLALVNVTERLCRAFQRLTGRTNVWLAVQLTNLSIVVYFVGAGVYFWSIDTAPRIALAVFCGTLLYVLSQTILKEPIDTYENNAFRRVAKGLRNPRRMRDAPLRISFLTLSLVLLYPIALAYLELHIRIGVLSYSLIVLTTVVLYLLACDPLPPAPGRLQVWLGRLASSRLAASESAPPLLVTGQTDPLAFGGAVPGDYAGPITRRTPEWHGASEPRPSSAGSRRSRLRSAHSGRHTPHPAYPERPTASRFSMRPHREPQTERSISPASGCEPGAEGGERLPRRHRQARLRSPRSARWPAETSNCRCSPGPRS